MRPAKPWRRRPSNAWYAKIGGRQVKLAEPSASFSEAQAAMVRLKASAVTKPKPTGSLTTEDLFDLFCADIQGSVARGELEQVTLDGYLRFLPPASAAFGKLPAEDVRPRDVKTWIDGRSGWGATTRFNAVTAVKVAFRWGRRQGHLEVNPLADMQRPTPRRREEVITPDQADRILAAVPDHPFRDLLTALRETGCRPGEATGLTARDIDCEAGTWTVRNKTRRKTGRPTRTVYLTPQMVDMSRRLAAEHPEGPVFRNRRGNGWTRHAIACRFADLRAKLGLGAEATAYAFRHLYATDALDRGVPVATVAELMGHCDTTMLTKVYSKLRERREHLRKAAMQARGG